MKDEDKCFTGSDSSSLYMSRYFFYFSRTDSSESIKGKYLLRHLPLLPLSYWLKLTKERKIDIFHWQNIKP